MIKLLFWGLLLLPIPVWAQVELIVRTDAGLSRHLLAILEDPGASKQGDAPLFLGVTEIRRVERVASRSTPAATRPSAHVLTVPDSAAFERLLLRWRETPGVRYAQPNHTYALDALSVDDDPYADSLTHLQVIRAREGWVYTQGSASVRIGQVDSGVFFAHPDLATQMWINPAEDIDGDGRATAADLNGVDEDGNGYIDDLRGFDFVDRPFEVEAGDYHERDGDASDDNRNAGGRGHGTTVAGVMVAAAGNGIGITGVAPGVRLVPLRAFGADGRGEDDDIAAAILYAADNGIDVLNLSFGDVYYSPLMRESIQYAVSKGVIVVASAGNLGGDDPHYPSDYPEVISAVWLTQDGTGLGSRATYGTGVDLGAPGSQIYTTLLPSPSATEPYAADQLYGRRSGSSVAAPMVSGAAALLRSLAPALTPASVRAILTGSALDLDEEGWDHRTGAGLLDVETALRRALPARVELLAPDQDAGLAGTSVAITGTVTDPSFASYSLYYAEGVEVPGAWMPLVEHITTQVWAAPLAEWETGALPEGAYTLRLSVRLRTGALIEDRRRIYLDRTPPVLDLKLLEKGVVDGNYGVVVDLATDDLTDVSMVVLGNATLDEVRSDRRARRHGLSWQKESYQTGSYQVKITATNVSGLSTSLEEEVNLPVRTDNSALFTEEILPVAHGFLLPEATDFDGDGLLELVLNQYQDGWIGDTLKVYEWGGEALRTAAILLANVIPRDVGDSNGNGLQELLTQVGGATLLLEQPNEAAYPSSPIFIDTTGLLNPFDPSSAFGARLTDLDQDGRGEILVHNTRQWRILEAGDGYAEVARLENPTGVGQSEIDQNEYQEPHALVGDFDDDGLTDLLVGDSDGDWIMYENEGEDRYRVAWTFETDRYNAGSRFVAGDFDGDGSEEFVTFTQNWTQITREKEREPDIGVYYLWDGTADDTYDLLGKVAMPGGDPRHGSLGAADFDGDGREELVVVQPPHLYVMSWDGTGDWRVRFVRQLQPVGAGVRSIEMVIADFDEDGAPEIMVAGEDEKLHRLIPGRPALTAPPPQWVSAHSRSESEVYLAWIAEGADSVTVFQGALSTSLDPVLVTSDQDALLNVGGEVQVALRAWRRGEASPLSPVRTIRPHAPVVVESLTYPSSDRVELLFSGRIAAMTTAEQFFTPKGSPASLLLGEGGRKVTLRFDDIPGNGDLLFWGGVLDTEAAPVPSTGLALTFPAIDRDVLIITRWEILDLTTVRLHFNRPLDPSSVGEADHYTLQPEGRVASVLFDPAAPASVEVRVAGRVLGATGLETSLQVQGLFGAGGEALASEGHTVRLVEAAEDLKEVFIFPNPFVAARHQPRMMVAGLPEEATVQVFSTSGLLIRTLEERDGDGGAPWDLKDEAGRDVPSGIYLVRVEAGDMKPVLRKAAVVR